MTEEETSAHLPGMFGSHCYFVLPILRVCFDAQINALKIPQMTKKQMAVHAVLIVFAERDKISKAPVPAPDEHEKDVYDELQPFYYLRTPRNSDDQRANLYGLRP